MVCLSEVCRLCIAIDRRNEVLVHRHVDHLCQVQCAAVRRLGDLLAATEAIGDDQGVFGGVPQRRQ
jgi:hypothetical protein